MRIVVKLLLGAACVSLLGAVSASCATTTCQGAGTCEGIAGPGADGGPDGGADVVAPPGCDLTKALKDSPACVDESIGVFVSPTGKDGAAGTKADPLKSMAEAVTKGKPRVYVCEGSYDTAVTISQPIAIFGGLTCAWAPSDAARPKLAPPKGLALRVMKVSGAVVVQDFDVVGSADVGTPGDSAIAAFVSESTNVTYRRMNLAAGPGTAGRQGVPSSNYTATAKDGAGALNGGAVVTCTCLDGSTSSSGGKGGLVGAGGDPGSATPPVGSLNGGGGGNTCLFGGVGANGLANAKGLAGPGAGELKADGWAAEDKASSGLSGNPGQGGGGGGGRTAAGSGGGGACGGCGGGGGNPGGPGGSSFALLSFSSSVSTDGGSMTTAKAGVGGSGGDGQAGQGGGNGGPGVCDGGPGGSGAGGSGGGGGAGGHSVPIAFLGTEPQQSGATMLTPGVKGGGGEGGKPGAGPGNQGNAGATGADGKAQNVLGL